MDQNKLNEISFNILNSAILGEIIELSIFDDLKVNVAEFENEILELEFVSEYYYANFKVAKDLSRLATRLKESLSGYNYSKRFKHKINNDGSGYYTEYNGKKIVIKAHLIDEMVNPNLFLEEDYTDALKYADNDQWVNDAVKFLRSKNLVPDDSTFNIEDVQISIGNEFRYAHLFMDDIAGYIKFEDNNISLEDAINKLIINKNKIERIHCMSINRFVGTKFINFTHDNVTIENDDSDESMKVDFDQFIEENELPEELQLFLGEKSLELETDNVTDWIKENSVEITEDKIQLKGLTVFKDKNNLLFLEKKEGRFSILSQSFTYKALLQNLKLFVDLLNKNKKRYNELSIIANRPDNITVSLSRNGDQIYLDGKEESNLNSRLLIKNLSRFKRG